MKKYFAVDLGFRELLTGKNGKDIGQVLENIVYLELLRRGYNITIGKIDKQEAGFICRKPDNIIHVQATYCMLEGKTRKREYDSLLKIEDNYPKYIISCDKVDFSYKGIRHLNIIDFLKNENI